MLTAIVYTSNTGYTAQYAHLLGDTLHLPVHSLAEAAKALAPGSEILYLGWLMASKIQGYQKAAGGYHILAVCGVGMGKTGTQLEEVKKANALPEGLPLFTLQGGFDMSRLHGLYKLMMVAMKGTVGKQLAKKPDRTPDEEELLSLLERGGSCVSEKNLSAVLAWYSQGLSSKG